MLNSELSALIDSVYQAAMQQQWQSFVDAFAHMFPGTAVAMNGHDQDRGGFVIAAAGNEVPAARGDDWLAADDAYQEMLSPYDVGQIYQARDCALPAGYAATSGSVLAKGSGRLLFIAAYFTDAGELQNSEGVNELLRLLVPHIVQATSLYRKLHATRAMASEFGGLMDALSLPAVVSDENARFLIANNAGDQLLATGGSLFIDSGGYVAVSDNSDTSALRSKIRQAIQTKAPTGLRIYTDDFHRSVRIVPLGSTHSSIVGLPNLLFDQQPRVAIFVGQKDGFTIDDSILLDVFGLTPRESEVCRKLLAMQTPTEIADKQNKSLRTVRNQVQSIYCKLGITRSAELSETLEIFKVIGHANVDQP